ncbi:MAG: VOC family protein [Acidiferrobacterales bacterium]|nr:VOC family protein [Acidiferrobacterales bacterium]
MTAHFDTIRWADVSVRDWTRAKAFYAAMFDWEFADQHFEGRTVYSLARLDGPAGPHASVAVAGLGPAMDPDADDGPKSWRSYINVSDLASTLDKVDSARGQVIMPPMDVMDAGVMAVCKDSNGAVFSLWQPVHHTGHDRGNIPGMICWFELTSSDPQDSLEFYGSVFGWNADKRRSSTDEYSWIFTSGAKAVASMHSRLNETSGKALWLPFVRVASLSRTERICRELGGSVLFGPQLEAGIGVYAVVTDNERNMFGISQFNA